MELGPKLWAQIKEIQRKKVSKESVLTLNFPSLAEGLMGLVLIVHRTVCWRKDSEFWLQVLSLSQMKIARQAAGFGNRSEGAGTAL